MIKKVAILIVLIILLKTPVWLSVFGVNDNSYNFESATVIRNISTKNSIYAMTKSGMLLKRLVINNVNIDFLIVSFKKTIAFIPLKNDMIKNIDNFNLKFDFSFLKNSDFSFLHKINHKINYIFVLIIPLILIHEAFDYKKKEFLAVINRSRYRKFRFINNFIVLFLPSNFPPKLLFLLARKYLSTIRDYKNLIVFCF